MPLGPLLAGQLLRVNVWGFVGSWCVLQGEGGSVCMSHTVCVCMCAFLQVLLQLAVGVLL